MRLVGDRSFVFFFFCFQAEDGIRAYDVPGVQTCALPISTGILTGNRTIIVPLRTKEYWIHNGCTGAYTLIVIGASGTGHTLPQTAWTCVVCDGTNVDAKSLPVDNDGSLVGNLSIVGSVTATVDSSATNTVTTIGTLTSTSTGTPAAGIGAGLDFVTETSAANNEIGGVIESVTTDVDPTNEDFDMVFKTMLSGTLRQSSCAAGATEPPCSVVCRRLP